MVRFSTVDSSQERKGIIGVAGSLRRGTPTRHFHEGKEEQRPDHS
ncbi:hypothetical protein [Streptomyces sp. NPDC099088]